MPQGLSVSTLIDVEVNFEPTAIPTLNFDSLLIMGDSNVINIVDRIRSYTQLSAVAGDFGTTAPEYLAADLFFSQNPQPGQLYIGRWAEAATAGILLCGALSAAEQTITNWTSITAGQLKLAVDGGSLTDITCGSFAAAGNLNAVATIIQTAVRAEAGAYAAVTVVWNGTQFVITSGTTGASSAVAALTVGTAEDIAAQMMGTASTYSEIVPGIAAEAPVAAVTIMDGLSTSWYGLMFATTATQTDSQQIATAGYIEGSGNPHVYGTCTEEGAALTLNDSTSLGYQLKQLGYLRSFCQYCSTRLDAVASFFGRAFTVNFNGANSTITLMYKGEPGVLPEALNSTQQDALNNNNYNYFATFNNGASIIVNGKMASGLFFDEVWGVDWLANLAQTNLFNALYTTPTKIPQTDDGMTTLANAINAACSAGVNNGLIGAGLTWNEPGFGQLQQGDVLKSGYYTYQPPIASQNQSDRAARKSVPFQTAVALAGAVHTVSLGINVQQ